MKIFNTKKTTQELIGLGMALHGDRDTMETRIRGIFSRQRSARVASVAAMALVLALVFACFTTACQPVVANAAAAEIAVAASDKTAAAEGSLLQFGGYAQGVLDGDRISVTDANGAKHEFTWVDEGLRKTMDGAQEPTAAIPEGTYVTPGEVALRAAETAVTIWGDAVPASEIHVNMYTGNGLELVYYGMGFGGTPFESAEGIYGYADAVTGTVLMLDANYYGQITQKYGNDIINEKTRAWNWDNEAYAAAHTSDKALATATELIRTCFPTGEIVPRDANLWDAGSHTDGEQILWNGGYVAVVDAYIKMDRDPCYYVQVAVPLEDGADPCITIFGCYPLGWDYCCNQIHDPAVLKQELAEMEAIRKNNGRYIASGSKERAYDIFDEKRLNDCADFAMRSVRQKFYMADDVYDKEFIEEQGRERMISIGFIDVSLGTADPWSVRWLNLTTPEEVTRCALPGQTLEFSGSDLWAIYVGEGQCIYAKAEPDSLTGVITQASVADMMQGNHCHLQINDYMVVSPAVEYLLDPNDGAAPAAEEDIQLAANAAQAEELLGSTFTPMADQWKQGDSDEEYSKVFLVRYSIYPDDGYKCSEPMTDPAQVAAIAKRGNVLRFAWDGQGLYAVYLGDGLLAYADAERMTVRNAYVADWLNDKDSKPGCTCSILTW